MGNDLQSDLIQILRQICDDIANVPDECDSDTWGEFYSQMLGNLQSFQTLCINHGIILRIGEKQKDMSVLSYHDL